MNDIGQFDNENRNLFTGILGLLCYLNGCDDSEILRRLEQAFKKNEIEYGLYSRNPNWIESAHRVSHDEYIGIAMASVAYGLKNHVGVSHAVATVDRGETHNWYFSDHEPHRKSVFSLKKLFKFENPFDGGGLRNFSDRCFLKLCAGREASWFERQNFRVAAKLAARKPFEKTSSKILMMLKLKTLEVIQARKSAFFGHFQGGKLAANLEDKILEKTRIEFHQAMLEMYGPEYPRVLFRIYYRDENHPFHGLVGAV